MARSFGDIFGGRMGGGGIFVAISKKNERKKRKEEMKCGVVWRV